MLQILFIGKNDTIKTEFVRYFSKHNAIIVDRSGTCVYGEDYLLIFDVPYFETNYKKGIVIFLSEPDGQEMLIPKTCIGICESSNKAALHTLMENENAALTCGMSPTDTLTFSSLNETNIQLSLQRKVINTYGEIIEPHEFKSTVACRNTSVQLLLNAVKILIKAYE